MKKLLSSLIFITFVFQSFGQTLFTYGNHSVTSTEFLNAYNKNKTLAEDDAGALRNYLDLYIKFKLKVQAAKDMRLDTVPSLVADLQNFRSQIEGNYLMDEKEVDRLVDQAFERSQKDIHVVFFHVHCVDSIKNKNIAFDIFEKLKSGSSEDIHTSDKEVKIEKGDAGFITVFSLPYEFENIIFGLKPGQVSLPVETKNGWYIFKNAGERPAVGKITVAQILFAIPPADILQKGKTKTLADSVYNLLKNGSDFSMMAKEFSDDKTTYMNGGLMPEFGTGKFDSVFENHAFSLKQDGEISQPFETRFGFHILKRISVTPIPTDKKDDDFLHKLKTRVLNDSRISIAKEKFYKEIISKTGLKKSNPDWPQLWQFTDSALLKNKMTTVGKINENSVLLTFNNHRKATVHDWIDYVKNSDQLLPEKMHESYEKIFPAFTEAFCFANYAARLEDFDPSFKSQVAEFQEGNMLFEIMKRKVWNKASEDSLGLENYYNLHKEKYFWNSSAASIIFSCSDKNIGTTLVRELQKGENWRELLAKYPSQVQADSGRFELGQIPVIDRTHFTEGLITLPVVNKNDGTAVFAQILKLYPPHQQRSFEDAKGQVMNDYQNYLEQIWISQLKKKYPVKVNENTLGKLLNQ